MTSFLSFAQSGKKDLRSSAKATLDKAINYFHSVNIEGGYVYHYTLDLTEKWGEGKTDDHTIEVQPPGTPAVGLSFLKAYQAVGEKAYLDAALDAAKALIKGQNNWGGWEHKIHFNDLESDHVSFDDDQTQGAIRFLMSLDEVVDEPELTHAIERALGMMINSQLENGGWPHRYPAQGNYHDFATFNDAGINDCIEVMLQAHRQYRKKEYLESLKKVGRFLMISQLPPPQPGWAQQYNQYLQPAWARAFEPPSVCPSVSLRNIHSLLDLYLYLGNPSYLEAIPDVIRWVESSQLPNGKWGRFLEMGTNQPLYYDRGRIRVNTLEELSLERRTGYGYENDLSGALHAAKLRFNEIGELNIQSFPHSDVSKDHMPTAELAERVKGIISSQDDQGRWIVNGDKFRKVIPGEKWNGQYRVEDRISSALFNENVGILCEYLARQ